MPFTLVTRIPTKESFESDRSRMLCPGYTICVLIRCAGPRMVPKHRRTLRIPRVIDASPSALSAIVPAIPHGEIGI